jgi:hypothetical protein
MRLLMSLASAGVWLLATSAQGGGGAVNLSGPKAGTSYASVNGNEVTMVRAFR